MPGPYPELEQKLRPLADPLPVPRPGDWLAEHDEPGQTFAEYLDARPVRKSDKLHTIYLCLVGDFTEAQRRVFFSVGRRLCQVQGAEAVILGGTDLFLAFAGEECGFPVIDCAEVHVDALYQRSASHR